MRPRIYPEYYINTKDGIRTQVDKSHFFAELKKCFPNPKEILNKLENEDTGVSAKDKYFFVVKK
ncbi:MAG: hypothetical protein PHC54_01925 [Candidatus Omnitrophica bacterium]|nr:hypothetical protein [Candidatus Omnitrophota bacterium]MDD5592055.1 hypothetical protein [Candidatus Omnitrophota bacterium]